jgi:hypothetical protein
MFKRALDLIGNDYVAALAAATAIFVALVKFIPLDVLIMYLNGVFVGTMFSISIAYGGIFFDAFWNRKRNGDLLMPDVRQFTVWYLATWVAYGLTAGSSIYINASDYDPTTLTTVALSRYVAILAAIGQVTAPDYGRAMFYGRDRKVLWLGLVLGVLAAFFVVQLQENKALAELLIWRG